MPRIDSIDPSIMVAQNSVRRTPGMKYLDSSGASEGDSACISKDGYELSRQVLAEREKAAKEKDAAERYQAALELGQDFAEYIDENINILEEDGSKRSNELLGLGAWRESQAFTTVSKQGTVVGVSYTAPNPSVREANYEVYTVQITRKDGFQLNVPFDDDMRVNDLENGGLSIYYASSGLTRTYDADGHESVMEGEKQALGTGGDDIILNRFSTQVDAGDGDDTVINLAKKADILGGAGNDKIYIPVRGEGINIDGGAGDDAIVGESISGGRIIMGDGNDSLTASSVQRASIVSSGNDSVKIENLRESSLDARNGLLRTDLGGLRDSDVNIERLRGDFVFNGAMESNFTFGDGDVNFSGALLSSNVTFGDGNVNMRKGGIGESTITFGNGNSSVDASGMYNSKLLFGDGEKNISTSGITNSEIELSSGDTKIAASGLTASNVHSKSGNVDISLSGTTRSTITAENGDLNLQSTFLVDGTVSSGGNGSLNVRSTFLSGGTISSGAGNDTVYADNANSANIRTGGGNDTIKVRSASNSVIDAGEGHNTVWVGESDGKTVISGSGTDDVWVGSAADGARLDLQTGNTSLVSERKKLFEQQNSEHANAIATRMTAEAVFAAVDAAQTAPPLRQEERSREQRDEADASSVASRQGMEESLSLEIRADAARNLTHEEVSSERTSPRDVYRKNRQAAAAYARLYMNAV